MVDIIAGDGDTTDITAVPGDRVIVDAGVEFLARILGPVGPVDVVIDGTVETDYVASSFLDPILNAVLLEGAGNSLTIGEAGVIDADNAVRMSGADYQFENAGVITSSVSEWFSTPSSTGVLIDGETGSFLNSGTIGRDTMDLQNGVVFRGSFGAGAEDPVAENSGKITGYFTGATLNSFNMTFTNSGRIAGEVTGVELGGDGNTLVNTGILRSASDMPEQSSLNAAVSLVGRGGSFINDGKAIGGVTVANDDVTVENSGTIRSVNVGVEVFSDREGSVDEEGVTTGFSLTNTGIILITKDQNGFPDPFPQTYGLRIDGNGADVVNDGKIVGATFGVSLTGLNVALDNSGLIESALPEAGFAVVVEGEGARFENSGTVEGASIVTGTGATFLNTVDGVLDGDLAPGGLGLAGTDMEAVNRGHISCQRVAVSFEDGAEGLVLRNSGVIEAIGTEFEAGIGVLGTADSGKIVNSGSITGTTTAVSLAGEAAVLRNTGEISGGTGPEAAVILAGDGILFRNLGLVDGDVAVTGGTPGVEGGTYNGVGGEVTGEILMSDGDDRAVGGDLRDVIRGNGGDDRLIGNGGDDELDGGAGNDVKTGGAGADSFVFAAQNGDDVVTDFEDGLDTLDLTNLGPLFEADVLAALSASGDGVLLDLTAIGGSGSVLLEGAELADVGLDDLLFDQAVPLVALSDAPIG